MAKKLPNAGDLTPEQLANPQAFMPNPNRLFTAREDKDALKRYLSQKWLKRADSQPTEPATAPSTASASTVSAKAKSASAA